MQTPMPSERQMYQYAIDLEVERILIAAADTADSVPSPEHEDGSIAAAAKGAAFYGEGN